MQAMIQLTPAQYDALKEATKVRLSDVECFINAMRGNDKIDMIKSLRTMTGCGLLKGKNFVETFEVCFTKSS